MARAVQGTYGGALPWRTLNVSRAIFYSTPARRRRGSCNVRRGDRNIVQVSWYYCHPEWADHSVMMQPLVGLVTGLPCNVRKLCGVITESSVVASMERMKRFSPSMIPKTQVCFSKSWIYQLLSRDCKDQIPSLQTCLKSGLRLGFEQKSPTSSEHKKIQLIAWLIASRCVRRFPIPMPNGLLLSCLILFPPNNYVWTLSNTCFRQVCLSKM